MHFIFIIVMNMPLSQYGNPHSKDYMDPDVLCPQKDR